MAYPEFLLDKRVLQRNIAKGLVDKAGFDDHLEALPDVEANAQASLAERPAPEGADDAAAETSGGG